MPTPRDPHLDELRALRIRAYGPHADIHEDEVALARLHELEAHASDVVGDPSNHHEKTAKRGVDWIAADDASADAGQTSVEPEGDESAVSTSAVAMDSPVWWRRRVPVLWAAAGVVVGLLLGIGLTLLQPAASDQVAVLHADPDAEWPNQMFGVSPEGGQRYDEFHGLTVITYEQSTADEDSLPCLAVLTSPNGAGFAGGGCGAGPFPATVSLQITSLLPQALRDEFPEGTSLQFVRDGAQVQVHAAQPITARQTP